LKLKTAKWKVKKFCVWCWTIVTPIERQPNSQLPKFQPPVEGEIEPQYEPQIETEDSCPKTRSQKWKRGLVTFGYFLWDCLVCVGWALALCAITFVVASGSDDFW
jgi:hypothetical protein